MGNPKYNEPTSFEEMEGQDATPETPKTEVGNPTVSPVEKTETTE